MNDANDIHAVLVDEPVNNAIVLDDHFSNVLAFDLRDLAATERMFFQPIHRVDDLLKNVFGVVGCLAPKLGKYFVQSRQGRG